MNGEAKTLDLRELGMVTTLASGVYKGYWDNAAQVGGVPEGIHQVVISGEDVIAHCPDNSPRSSILADYFATMTPEVVMQLIRIAETNMRLSENLRISQGLAAANVTSVKINPGDVLIIRIAESEGPTTHDHFEELARNLSQHFPQGTPVLLTNDIDISALDEDAMRQAGWVKAGNRDDELRKKILEWWDEHQYDTMSYGDGDERNVYDNEPDFVILARETTPNTQPALDPRTPDQMIADGWKPV
jgi:hypothetical protein